MPRVRFTRHLLLHFPDLREGRVAGSTLSEVVGELERRHPGLAGYLVDDRGALRKHVNIFVNDELLRDRAGLSDPVGEADQVFIMQALSGG
ncbi:MAG: MoaD/ThiS family protein [Candidatus Eiseniibacteriota bacterium]|jgi:molybdopterin converting factor small subunit